MVSDGPVRLVLVHHAGGSRMLFRGWDAHLPSSWEVVAADAPGRGLAHEVPLPHQVDDVAGPLADRLRAAAPMPLALFGHSMGAAVAARTAALLVGSGGPEPVWLGLSGWAARRGAGRAAVGRMSDERLGDLMTRMGGTPGRMLADPVLLQLVLPLLRADLAALEDFDPLIDPGWLGVPLSLFAGAQDTVVSEAQLAALGGAARTLVGVHLHPGGHFYLTGRVAEVATQVVHDVRVATGTADDMHQSLQQSTGGGRRC